MYLFRAPNTRDASTVRTRRGSLWAQIAATTTDMSHTHCNGDTPVNTGEAQSKSNDRHMLPDSCTVAERIHASVLFSPVSVFLPSRVQSRRVISHEKKKEPVRTPSVTIPVRCCTSSCDCSCERLRVFFRMLATAGEGGVSGEA